jgi:hypothetical protein
MNKINAGWNCNDPHGMETQVHVPLVSFDGIWSDSHLEDANPNANFLAETCHSFCTMQQDLSACGSRKLGWQ